MKKLIALFTVLSFTLAAIGQNDTTRYTMVNGYGFTYNRLKAKAALVMPADTIQNKLPGSLVVLNDSLYVRTGVKWEKIGANAAVDTVIMSTRAWRQKGDDSVSALVALRVRISDTASMLLPYLRKSDTSAMLSPYFRKGDTVTLSNRINTKLNISDTAAMLAPYAKAVAGLPIGGTTGQILAKNSATNYDVAWIDNYTTDVRETVKATESINKGQAVYVTGADGTNVLVSKASNTSDATSSKTLGLLYQNLATNGQGFVIIQGRLSGLNTIGATAGDPVWLGTNGNLLYGTANKPVAPAHMVYIGVVTRVNSNNGEIFVNVQNGFELEELHNVLITDSINNQVIAYDSTTRLWKNKTIAQALGYTPANNATTVKYSDTASMLSPYLRDADTATLSNRINLKVNISDTASMLSPYARTSNVNAALALKVNISDTSSMLTPYLRKADTTAMLSPYARTSNVNAALATKLNISDTASMLSPYLKESDTLFLSNRINLKVNISDTSSMLSPYIRAAGYGLIKSGQSLLVDTAAIATRARVQKAVDSLGAGKTNGSGTVNYVAKWTGTSTLGNSLIQDNGTSVGIGRAPVGGDLDVYDGSYSIIRATGGNGGYFDSYTAGGTRLSSFGSESNGDTYAGTRGSYPLYLMTNSTIRQAIFSNGNVGINTTTDAGFKLDVAGTARISSDLRVNATTGFNTLFTQGIGGGGIAMVSTTDPTASANRLFSLGFGSVNYPAQARIEAYSTEAWTSTNRGSYLTFRTTPTGATGVQDRMFIGNDGFVGINTLTPLARLHVAGNMRSDNDAFFATSAGNVGIGTASPSAKLQIGNNTESSIGIKISPPLVNWDISANSGGDFFIGNGSGAYLTFSRPSFVSSFTGSLGIGTSSPSEALDVNGRARVRVIDSTASAMNVLYADVTGVIKKASATAFPGGSGTTNYIPLWTGTNTLGNSAFFQSGSNIGLGRTNPSYKFDLLTSTDGFDGYNVNNSNAGANAISGYRAINGNGIGLIMGVTEFNASSAMGGANQSVIYGVGSQSLIFGTNSTERMRIFNNGRVFVGASPADAGYLFDVNGTIRNTGAASFATSDGNVTVGSTTPVGKLGVVVNDANGGGIRVQNNINNGYMTMFQMGGTGFGVSNWANSSVIESVPVSTGGLVLSSFTGSTIFQNNGRLESMRIRQDGEVAINLGTGDFGNYKFQVDGAMYATGQSILAATSGNVGIGTASPQNYSGYKTLEIQNTNGGVLRLTNPTSSVTFENAATPTETYIKNVTNLPLWFGTNNTERIRIEASGNVGVGGNPLDKMTVIQDQDASTNFRVRNSNAGSSAYTMIGVNASGNSWGMRMGSTTANSNAMDIVSDAFGTPVSRMRFFTNGRISVNTTTDGGYQFDVNGNTRVTGKIDVTANVSIGHNIARSGTSDIAAQIYSSNAWLLYGAESSTGGSILTGSTQYAAVVGSGYNRPLQFGTNSTVRMEIDSTGLVGINTTAPTERLDVNGKARIRTVDSTATAINMLYVDATGVVKKTAVPGSSIEYYTDVNTIASGWTYAKDSTRNLNHNFINVVKDVNTNEATATMQIAVYKSTSSFTTGSWQSIATVPAAYAPKTTVYYELPGYVDAATFYTSSNVRFTGASEYTGTKVVSIDPSGNVTVRIGTVSGSVTSGGTNYVLIPLALTWVVYNAPQ